MSEKKKKVAFYPLLMVWIEVKEGEVNGGGKGNERKGKERKRNKGENFHLIWIIVNNGRYGNEGIFF